MKKLLTLLLTVTLVFSCIGCGSKEEDTSDAANVEAEVQTETGDDAQAEAESEEADAAQEPEAADETQSEDTTDVKSEGVMTYDEYVAADLESEVVVETYVQAKQSWWEDKATLYTQDKDGAYFVYNVACSEEDYAKLTPGTKIKVTGYKSEWSGEVEIIDGTFEIEEGNYVAAAEDVTALLGADELIDYQNRFVCF